MLSEQEPRQNSCGTKGSFIEAKAMESGVKRRAPAMIDAGVR
jgi:hypothetical protein